MATINNQVQKIVRHYVPMIRFKYGANRESSSKDGSSTQSAAARTNETKTTQTSGTLEFFETPARYRRRPLTQDEIDLVKIGGSV